MKRRLFGLFLIIGVSLNSAAFAVISVDEDLPAGQRVTSVLKDLFLVDPVAGASRVTARLEDPDILINFDEDDKVLGAALISHVGQRVTVFHERNGQVTIRVFRTSI